MNDQDHATPASQPSIWRKPAVAGVAVAAGVLLVGGAGAAIGIGIASSDRGAEEGADETVALTAAPTEPDTEVDTEPDTEVVSYAANPHEADALSWAITQAIAEAAGVGATEIEVRNNSWQVEVQRADGTEAEVVVSFDGTSVIREEDEDDDDDDPLIDLEQLSDLVSISLATAGSGVVEQISTDDDDDHFYEVEVRLESGAEVEIEFDAELNVIEVD